MLFSSDSANIMTGIEKSLQLSAANHYTMFLIYPSSARQTIIAQKGRGFVLSLCCSRKKSPTRAPNRSSIPRFPVFRRYTAGGGQPALRKCSEQSRPSNRTEKARQRRAFSHSLTPFGNAETGRDRSAAADRIKFPIKVRACT